MTPVLSAGPRLVLVAVSLLMGVVEHQTGRGLNFSIYLRQEDREILDRLRGEQSASSYLRDLLREKEALRDSKVRDTRTAGVKGVDYDIKDGRVVELPKRSP